MKVGLIVPGGVDRSGQVRVIPALLALIRRLSSVHDIHVFALRQEPLPGSWPLAGASVHNVGANATLRQSYSAIRDENRRGKIDVLQAIWSGRCGLLAVACGRFLEIPSLIHVAGGELADLQDISYGGRRRLAGRLREALVLRAAHAVTAASAPMIEFLRELGIRGERLPLGVDLDTWPVIEPRRRKDGADLRLIHVASLNRVKDQTMLLHALAILKDRGCAFHLDVAGEDTLRGAIQSLSHDLGLAGSIDFHGFVPQTELHLLMRSADVHLVSSRHEAGPVAMLEAAVAGVPTVGTRVGHLAEWSPVAAIAVPISDSVALAEAVINIACDEEKRLSLAMEAQARATYEDADHCAQRFMELFERATASAN